MNLSEDLASYCRRKFFLFLPNICDASCSFCYMNPVRAKTGTIAQSVVTKARVLMRKMVDLGFSEVRFTGGEPLTFENLDCLTSAAVEEGMSYSLLTNGLQLGRSLENLRNKPPSKITISIHSLARSSLIFQSPMESEQLLDSISEYLQLGTSITATLVCLPITLEDLPDTLDRLYGTGVRDYKLVALNSNAGRTTANEELLQQVVSYARVALPADARVRYTDLEQRTCLLRRQGELSVSLPKFEWSWCCATMGTQHLGNTHNPDSYEFAAVRGRLAAQLNGLQGLPCPNQGYCPISLLGRP